MYPYLLKEVHAKNKIQNPFHHLYHCRPDL